MRYAIGIADMLRAKLTEKDAAIEKLTALLQKTEQALADANAQMVRNAEIHSDNLLRTVNAEQALALRGEPAAKPFGWWIEGDGINSHFTQRKASMEAMLDGWRNDDLKTVVIPLYAAPISGERTDNCPFCGNSFAGKHDPMCGFATAPVAGKRAAGSRVISKEGIAAIFKAMSVLVQLTAKETKRETDPEYIKREPVMDEVMHIRQAMDGMTPAVSGERVREALALIEQIGNDWKESGATQKFHAATYLAKAIRAALPLAAQPEGK